MKQPGFTIAEMIISLIIVGLSAALLAPKVLTTQEETSKQTVTLRVDAIKYQMNADIKLFQNQYNLNNDDLQTQLQVVGSTVTFPNIYSMFGNYYAYKNAGTTASPINYYFMMDRSKLSFDRTFFVSDFSNTQGTNYATSGLPNYPSCLKAGVNYCFYMDVNGPANPNKFGVTGDIIQMYINPDTYEVSTLYEATLDCTAYSQYDALTHPTSVNGTGNITQSCP